MEIDFPLTKIKEGKIEFYVPDFKKFEKEYKAYSSVLPVFYNPVMKLNRDFAVLVVQVFQMEKDCQITVCEPLAGCGVRGLRFAKEVEGVEEVVVNDLNPKAYKLIQKNISLNGLEKTVKVYCEDANFILSRFAGKGKRFDVVDVDPFGSPAPYLNSALRATKNGGLLCLTATDTAVLCGVHSKACLRRYEAKPLRTEYNHELAVRILVGFVCREAAKIDLAIQPVFCHSTNHYVRVYVKIFRGAKKADKALTGLGYIYHCFNCLNRKIFNKPFPENQTCEICGGTMDFAGPLWVKELWDKKFVEKMLNLANVKDLGKNLNKILWKIFLEIEGEPTYYVLSYLCDFLNIPTPSYQSIFKKLEKEGFKVTPTHFNPQGLKTNAPINILKKILLENV